MSRRIPGSHASPKDILRNRARDLARKPESLEGDGDVLEVIEFHLGRERLALESAWVSEVFTPPGLVHVPCTPPFVAGLVNLRGRILSILDLRQVLGLSGDTERMKVVLLLSDEEMELGILAERVEGARRVLRHEVAPPLSVLSEHEKRFQRGVLPGPVSLLDARALLASSELRVEDTA